MTEKIKAGHAEVRKFGLLFAAIGTAAGGYMLYRGSALWLWPVFAALLFLAGGVLAPAMLRPFYVAWMKFAALLAWMNTRIILGLFFYLLLTPLGVILRMGGKDLLNQKRERSAPTFWIRKEKIPFNPKRYERLF